MNPILTGLQGLSTAWNSGTALSGSMAAPALTDTNQLSANFFPTAPVNGAMGFHDQMFGAAPAQQQGMFGGQGGFMNGIGGIQGIASILGSLGGLYSAFQGAKIARDSLNFQREAYTKNLQNQTQSYNTALSDRARSRGVMEHQSAQQVDDYINANKLSV